MPDHSQFNTDSTYPGRWTITFSNSTLLPPHWSKNGAKTTDVDLHQLQSHSGSVAEDTTISRAGEVRNH
jgi:hypothetical protein